MQIFRTFSSKTSFVCVFVNSLLWQRAYFAKSLFWQRACSSKEPALAKSLLRHLLKTLCLEHILDTKMTQIIYDQQSRDTDNFFRCMLSLLYSFGLFVCGFLNFLQCFFFFLFVFFFLLELSLLGSLFRFFSPPFCLLVYFNLFWLFFVLSFCFVLFLVLFPVFFSFALVHLVTSFCFLCVFTFFFLYLYTHF